jgi:molybdate transport system ATP-binding protein
LLHGLVVEHDSDRELTRLDAAGATFWVPLMDTPVGGATRIRIPAREVILAGKPPESISLHNIIAGTVRRIAADPARRAVMVEIALADGALLARVTRDAIARLALSPGGEVLALIKSTSIEVLGA